MMKYKHVTAILAAVLLSNCITGSGGISLLPVSAVEDASGLSCFFYEGTNMERHNYTPTGALNFAMPVASTLVPLSDGTWMKVQGELGMMPGHVLIEYYDASFMLIKRKTLELQLPKYGCFYIGSDGYYYLLSGQDNEAEDDTTAVFDIAKYSPDWELISDDTLCGVNTAKPFEAGSARCADDGEHLIIHTCHELYGNGTDQGHQASITMEVDMDKVEFTDVFDGFNNESMDYGVVSHSLNQFVLIDDGKLIELDHGDAHPRSIALTSYFTDYTTGKFINREGLRNDRSADTYDLYDINLYNGSYRPSWVPSGFSQNSAINYTGVTLGGFVQSSTHYIAAYSSIDQAEWILHIKDNYPESHKFNDPRNVMVSALPKDALNDEYDTMYNYNKETANAYKENIEQQVAQYQVTHYKDEEGAAQCPHLTPIGNDRFILMWQRENDKVNYTFLDHTGAVDSEIYEMEGALSDCEPVLKDDAVYWYTWKDAEVTFYSIDVNQPESTGKVVFCSKHDYEITYPTNSDPHAYETCKKCGNVIVHTPPTDFTVTPNKLLPSVVIDGGGGTFRWGRYNIGRDELFCDSAISFEATGWPQSDNAEDRLFCGKVIQGAEYVQEAPDYYHGDFPVYTVQNFDGDSILVKIAVYPKYNPSLTKTITFSISHYEYIKDSVAPTEDHKGLVVWKCSDCNYTKDILYEPFSADNGMIPDVTLSQDTFVYNGKSHFPDFTFTLKDPQTGETKKMERGVDFVASSIHNTEVGTAYLVIAPLSENPSPMFKGILTVPYTILPRTQEDVTPCTNKHTLEITDFTLPVYTTKGTVTWTCSKCGYETQTVFEPFEVAGDIKGEVVFSQDTFEFDHSAHKPNFRFYLTNEVTGERTLLLPEIDYNYYYTNNVNAGTANLIITPQTHTPNDVKFKGDFVAEFTIEPQDLSGGTVTYLPSTYDPHAPETDIYSYVRPQFVIRDKQGYILEENDYYPKGMFRWDEDRLRMTSVSFSFAAKSPNYTIGIGDEYEVPLIDISNYDAVFADANLRNSGNTAYTGEAVEPLVNVTTSKGRVLQKDVDYRLLYQNNTARGIATVIVEGIGYYNGTIELHFGIGDGIHAAPPVKKGDVDGDGKVDKADVQEVSKMLTGETAMNQAADWNKDNVINAVDFTLMKRAVLNI